jgi:hypothetical protein
MFDILHLLQEIKIKMLRNSLSDDMTPDIAEEIENLYWSYGAI